MDTVAKQNICVKVEGNAIRAFTPFVLKDTCKSIPGAKWNPDAKCWEYPLTPESARAIHRKLPPRIPRDRSVMELVQRALADEAEAMTIKTSDSLPPIPVTKLPGWRHQLQAFWFAHSRAATMLAMDMGTGKSKVTIDDIQNTPGVKRVLIVCPKSVISVWPREFAKHCAIDYAIMPLNRYSIPKRVDEAKFFEVRNQNKMRVYVINYEAVWRDGMANWIKSLDWDFIICDESHRIKSHSGVASKFMGAIANKAKKRRCLTGTPLPHSPMDAFGQYRFLDASIFGTSFHVFKNTYAIFGGYQGHELVGYRNEDEFNRRFYSAAYRVGKEVLDLPEYNHVELTFELEGRALRAYRDMEDDFITWAKSGSEPITAANALVKLLRLQQITSGFLPDESGEPIEVHESKGEQLIELLEDIDASEPMVVFCRFRHDLDAVRRAATKAGRAYMELSGRVNQLEEFQNATGGEVIGVQMQSGGVGVDLTRARYCAYYSVGFSLGEYEQSLARTHRPGQTRPVTYFHLIAENTVDRKVYNALSDKKEVIDWILGDIQAQQ